MSELSFRDQCAISAMSAMLSNATDYYDPARDGQKDICARYAYEMADAMVAEKAKIEEAENEKNGCADITLSDLHAQSYKTWIVELEHGCVLRIPALKVVNLDQSFGRSTAIVVIYSNDLNSIIHTNSTIKSIGVRTNG